MVIRNNDWYNLNSTRHYPLDDNATGDSDSTGDLPSNIIVDCRIRFPRLAGKYIYISSVNVTENLVSIVFLAAQSVAAEKDGVSLLANFAPVAVVTVVNPEEYRPYPIEAMYPGVGGWIVFGSGVQEVYRGDFSAPEQSLLTPGAAQWYTGLPIPTVQKENVADTLTGLVRLKGSNTVSVTAPAAGRTINGINRRAIVISVKDDIGLLSLSDLIGPCGQRPESRTCEALPIEYINTVDPDCAGNIDIRFIGTLVSTYPYASLSSGLELTTAGVEIDFGLGITDACVTQECLPDDDGKLCNDYLDLCDSSSSESLGGGSSISSSSSSSSESLSLSSSSCGSLPYGTTFDDSTAQDFVVKSGAWSFKDLDSVNISESASAESQGWGTVVPGADIVYAPTDHTARNTSIWDSCDYEALVGIPYVDISRQRRTWSDVYIPADATAGIVFNYRNSPYTGNPHYLFAGIDTFKSQLLVGKFSGNAWTEVTSSGTAVLNPDTWYRIVGHTYSVNQQSTTVKIRVYEVNHNLLSNWPNESLCTPLVSLSITTNIFGKITLGAQSDYSYHGKAGVFAWGESGYSTEDLAYFSQFNFDKQVE
jgi:hypothetical protein